jgi:hypothetical protein
MGVVAIKLDILVAIMREVDLYPPLKSYLEGQGYEVKGEILNCDVVALRPEASPIIVELKMSLNMTILLQAVDRIKISNTVYVGVPKGLAILKKRRKQIVKLLRMLGLGLIVIDPLAKIGGIDILCDPGEYKPRQIKKQSGRLLKEFQERKGDPNQGGTSMKRGLLTAYRQKALAISEYLLEHGATKASIIAKSLEEPKTRTILYDNVYGWFDRLGKGVYILSPRGILELPDWLSKSDFD